MPLLTEFASPQSTFASYETTGGRLVCTDGRTLPVKAASLNADAKGGLIRVSLSQTFANPAQRAAELHLVVAVAR